MRYRRRTSDGRPSADNVYTTGEDASSQRTVNRYGGEWNDGDRASTERDEISRVGEIGGMASVATYGLELT
ncbi:unnamed protein product [Macrosiphum euphorbiae]|uniref:Uncharacterized protein n=1 Tax=Macrosiphum euphorbiae TaxID=13131 RepID=A0AAV0XV20_9HEMI|nr:unnamed protein product [Macrosiphum euphorbiae]